MSKAGTMSANKTNPDAPDLDFIPENPLLLMNINDSYFLIH